MKLGEELFWSARSVGVVRGVASVHVRAVLCCALRVFVAGLQSRAGPLLVVRLLRGVKKRDVTSMTGSKNDICNLTKKNSG